MSTSEIEHLLNKLERLQIARRQISTEELRVREQLQELNRGEIDTTTRADRKTAAFHVGEHAYIKNRITHVHRGKRGSPIDRVCIVQGVTKSRIDIKTSNGTETWRHPKNLRRLTQNEINLYIQQE